MKYERRSLALLVTTCALFALPACGGDDSEPSGNAGSGGTTVTGGTAGASGTGATAGT